MDILRYANSIFPRATHSFPIGVAEAHRLVSTIVAQSPFVPTLEHVTAVGITLAHPAHAAAAPTSNGRALIEGFFAVEMAVAVVGTDSRHIVAALVVDDDLGLQVGLVAHAVHGACI